MNGHHAATAGVGTAVPPGAHDMDHPRYVDTMRIRHLMAASAVALLALPASSALAGTRAMTITVPKSIQTSTPFTATYSGDTGPGNAALGGFIIYARLVKSKTCPANAAIPKHSNIIDIEGGNLFGSGAFSGGDRAIAYTPGKYTVCGYITQNTSTIAFDTVYQSAKQITVKKRPGFHIVKKLPKVKDGVYSAATAATVGGNPDASITFTVQGGAVVSAAATGIPTVSCFDGFTTQTPVTPAASSNIPAGGSPSKVYNTFSAGFSAPPNEEFQIYGGATSDKTVVGTVSGVSADGSCTGTFSFTAKRP